MSETVIETETVDLYGWCEFEFAPETIRAMLFAQLLKRAIPVTENYLSDLYHDSAWLRQNVNGECEFLFMVRHWGTNIAESARIQDTITSEPRVLYNVRLHCDDRRKWWVTFTVLNRVTAD